MRFCLKFPPKPEGRKQAKFASYIPSKSVTEIDFREYVGVTIFCNLAKARNETQNHREKVNRGQHFTLKRTSPR